MPIIKSAKKRVKVARKATIRNVKVKRNLREALKAFDAAVQSGKSAEISKTERAAAGALDKAAKKAVIHSNKAARQKARLAAKAKSKGVKPEKSSKPTLRQAQGEKVKSQKSTAKTPVTKKATVKKTTK